MFPIRCGHVLLSLLRRPLTSVDIVNMVIPCLICYEYLFGEVAKTSGWCGGVSFPCCEKKIIDRLKCCPQWPRAWQACHYPAQSSPYEILIHPGGFVDRFQWLSVVVGKLTQHRECDANRNIFTVVATDQNSFAWHPRHEKLCYFRQFFAKVSASQLALPAV